MPLFLYCPKALVQQEKDLTEQIKELQTQLKQMVPDKNHLKQLAHKVKGLDKGFVTVFNCCSV